MSETNQPEKEPTPAELKAYRESMFSFYKEQIPLLKQQADYERLLAEIEESRAKRLTMNLRIAQIMAGPPAESTPEDIAKREEMMRDRSPREDSQQVKAPAAEKISESTTEKSVRQLKSETP